MKASLTVVLLWFSAVVFSQDDRPFSSNTWLAVQGIVPLGAKWELQADAGHRRCNQFIRQSRQTLVRTTFLYRFSDKISAGAGFTWFGHVSNKQLLNEYRPFLQMNVRGGKKQWKHTLRLRNEWRLYPQRKEWRNRTRLQLGMKYTGFKYLHPYTTLEGFVTPGTTTILESRATIGITIPAGQSAFSLFYTEQQQSTIDYGQHIIGIQYSWTGK